MTRGQRRPERTRFRDRGSRHAVSTPDAVTAQGHVEGAERPVPVTPAELRSRTISRTSSFTVYRARLQTFGDALFSTITPRRHEQSDGSMPHRDPSAPWLRRSWPGSRRLGSVIRTGTVLHDVRRHLPVPPSVVASPEGDDTVRSEGRRHDRRGRNADRLSGNADESDREHQPAGRRSSGRLDIARGTPLPSSRRPHGIMVPRPPRYLGRVGAGFARRPTVDAFRTNDRRGKPAPPGESARRALPRTDIELALVFDGQNVSCCRRSLFAVTPVTTIGASFARRTDVAKRGGHQRHHNELLRDRRRRAFKKPRETVIHCRRDAGAVSRRVAAKSRSGDCGGAGYGPEEQWR